LDISDILKKNLKLKDIHAGKRCFILGNGPSTNNQDLLLLENEIKIVVNSIYKHEKIKEINPNYWLCVDPLIFEKKEQYLIPLINAIEEKQINVKIFFPINYVYGKCQIQKTDFMNLYYFMYDGSKTINDDINFSQGIPAYGQNVILVTMMLAFYLGCNPIYLLGCDHTWWKFKRDDYTNNSIATHSYKNGSDNYSQKYSYDFLQTTIYVQKYQYLQLIKYAEKRGIQIFNATGGGFLDLFPRANYEDLFPNGTRSINSNEILSAYPNISLELGKSAIKLINDGEYSSAFVLIEAAISKNFGKETRTEGLNYLKAVCLMGLGEHREAVKSARQECISPSNQDKTVALLRALGDEKFIQGMSSAL